jgi:PPOX class probable F420-dependent enzyme
MLEPSIRDLARGKNFGTLSVHLPNGHIATHVMWVDADDEHVLINTEVHRAKYRAITANPVVTVTIWDAENPYKYGEVRGRVVSEVRGPEARAHIDACSRKYTGNDYASPIQSERVILKIAPERQIPKGL